MTIDEMAAELGIDVKTLKPESVSKINGYFSDADRKYSEASQNLEAVKREQEAINQQIATFGITESTVLAQKANYAAMEAQLKALKESGLDVNIPAPVAANAPKEFDPNSFRNDVNGTIINGFNVNNRYQRLYGKALPDDLDVLAGEAQRARMPFAEYCAQKYDFAGEEKKQQAAAEQIKMDAYAATKLNEYKEKNPVVAGNSDLQRGIASRYPELKSREVKDVRKFTGLSAREKIMQSVARSREAVSANQ